MEAEWFTRIDAEHRAGNVTRAERDVLRALGRLLAMGDHAPSEDRVASEAACSKRSVARAKVTGRALGLLGWERRFASDGGLRRERPCAYRAETPTAPVGRRGCQRVRVQKEDKRSLLRRSVQQQLAALPAVTPGLVALWEARRAALGRGGGRPAIGP